MTGRVIYSSVRQSHLTEMWKTKTKCFDHQILPSVGVQPAGSCLRSPMFVKQQ